MKRVVAIVLSALVVFTLSATEAEAKRKHRHHHKPKPPAVKVVPIPTPSPTGGVVCIQWPDDGNFYPAVCAEGPVISA